MTEDNELDWEAFAKKAGFDSAVEMAEHHKSYGHKVEAIVKQGLGGTVACLSCQADAKWEREGQHFSVSCPVCRWGMAGQIPISEVPQAVN